MIFAEAPVDPQAAQTSAGITRQVLDEAQSIIAVYGLKLLGAIVFISVAWIVANWSTRLARRAMDRAKVDLTLAKFLANTIRWVVLALAGIGCLGIFGIQTTSFAAVIGAAGLAVGLAFQGTLSNLAAGTMLLIFRPFKIGDAVVVAGQTGIVDGIELFTTKLDTPDNRRIILPNAAVFNAMIENRSHHKDRRLIVDVGVVYSAPSDKVSAALVQAAEQLKHRLPDRPVRAEILKLGPLGVEWQVKVWVPTADVIEAGHELNRAVKQELQAAGIDFPYPPHIRGTV